MIGSIKDALRKSPLIYGTWLTLRCLRVKGYIFVASTGRSGTQSLSRIFKAADNAICVHEPVPVMYSDYPAGVDKKSYFQELFYKEKKNAIRRKAKTHNYYVETNHQFVKNFAELAIDYFKDKIRVIHLIRDPVKVATSFYKINSIPGKSFRGRRYLLDPLASDNRLDLSDLFGESGPLDHDYYRCLWYWYEIEARIKALKEKFPHMRWFTLRTEDLNSEVRLMEMFEALGVKYSIDQLRELVCTRVNLQLKDKQWNIDSREQVEMHEKFVKLIQERLAVN